MVKQLLKLVPIQTNKQRKKQINDSFEKKDHKERTTKERKERDLTTTVPPKPVPFLTKSWGSVFVVFLLCENALTSIG